MKKYTEVLAQIEKAREEMKHAKQEIESVDKAYSNIFEGLTLKERINKKKESEVIEKQDTYLKIVEKWANVEIDCKVKIALLKSNAKLALMNDILDVVVSAFNKFSGKSYGEKTKEKISNEVKEKVNCGAYISRNTIYVYTLDYVGREYDLEIGMKDYNNKLLIDNKIQKFTKDDLKLYNGNNNYIDNVDTEVEYIRNAQAKIIEKEQELKKMCEEYNKHTVNGIEGIIIRSNASTSFSKAL